MRPERAVVSLDIARLLGPGGNRLILFSVDIHCINTPVRYKQSSGWASPRGEHGSPRQWSRMQTALCYCNDARVQIIGILSHSFRIPKASPSASLHRCFLTMAHLLLTGTHFRIPQYCYQTTNPGTQSLPSSHRKVLSKGKRYSGIEIYLYIPTNAKSQACEERRRKRPQKDFDKCSQILGRGLHWSASGPSQKHGDHYRWLSL